MSRVRKLLAGLHDVRSAAAAFPDALLLLDACGRLRWCNPAADRLLGLAWPQHRGVCVAEHFADTEVGAWLRDGTSDPDDIANATNRSPWPTLHLLREDSVSRAVEAFPDPDGIIERNIETLRKLGHAGWRDLF